MVKLPAVGFMQDTYCTLLISFRDSLLLSYLGAQQKPQMVTTARAVTAAVPWVYLWAALWFQGVTLCTVPVPSDHWFLIPYLSLCTPHGQVFCP